MNFALIPTLAGRFIYGFIFGALVWGVLVHPYLEYYDFTRGSYGPMASFAAIVALAFTYSAWIRPLLVLFVPSMVGGASQNYVVMLLFSAMLLNPVTNIGLNAIESVRVIGCSLTMTFDQLRERAHLVLNPIVEILNDKDQTDLDPIRKSLFEIQQFVGKLHRNINSAVEQTSLLRGENSRIQAEASGISAKQEDSATRGGDELSGTKLMVPTTITTREPTLSNVEFEFDLENFGLKASIDANQLRALAKKGQLRRILLQGNETLAIGGDGSDQGGPANISDVLYDSCVAMFQSAKLRCSEAVADMLADCRSRLGPLLATWWCEPFTYGLDKFCPTIMSVVVNETNVCHSLKLSDLSNINVGLKYVNASVLHEADELDKAKYRDVNEAFRELTRQIGKLNENILQLDDDGSGKPSAGGGGGAPTMASERLQRFELSLTFNEQTRRVFQDIKQLIELITDKYKLRRLFADLLQLAYDLYTTYTFALILLDAWRYRRQYLANIKFDNCYITRQFVELDQQRRQRLLRRQQRPPQQPPQQPLPGAGSVSSLSVVPSLTQRSSIRTIDSEDGIITDSPLPPSKPSTVGKIRTTAAAATTTTTSVLPLTRDESQRYINPFTCLRRTKDERRTQSTALWTLFLLLILSLSVLYLDNIFYSILASIQEHSLIRYKEVGHHELEIKVYGTGVIARLVRRLVGSFSSAYKLNRLTSTQRCLPNAAHTQAGFYWNFLTLITIYFLIDQLAIYAKRLRPLTCAYFYPEREQSRVRYLLKFILFQRQKLERSGVKHYLVSEEEGEAEALKMANQKFEEELRAMEDSDAYSLRDALIYLRQCCSCSSQSYCACLRRILFCKRDEPVNHKVITKA